jgi:hypothetical protein
MKTILVSLLVSVSLLSPALSNTKTSLDSKEQCQSPAENVSNASKADWFLDKEYKNVTEDANTYSSVQVFSNKKYPDARVVIWYVDGCLDDFNQVSSEFVQDYVKKYVK